MPLNRREFLGTAALGAAALSPTLLPAADPAPSPAPTPATAGPKLRLGVIGTGGYGLANIRAAFRAGGVEVTALCDVDRDHLEAAAQEVAKLQGTRPRMFARHEDLVAADGLQAVIIATPPHWHALQLIAAVERGLDVYCEKPLAYDIREGRAMVDAAARTGRLVQVGFQRRQSPAYQEVRQFIADGHLGRVIQAEAQIHFTAGLQDPAPVAPPAGLDWDRWCGPGPLLPYSAQVGHKSWRLEAASGQGHLYDWGIHLVDAFRMMLGEGAPAAVTAAGGILRHRGRITTPDTLTAHFEFPRCPLTWRHRLWGSEEYTAEVNNGIFLYGEAGTVFVTDGRWVHIPKGKGAARTVRENKADLQQLHMADFLDAVRRRRPPTASLAEAHLSTTTVKLAMIALAAGGRVEWDAAREQVVGHPAAAALVRREYRAPWRHPGPA